MILVALALARKFWPIIVAVLAFGALMAWHRHAVAAAYRDGVTAERSAWEAESARLRAVAAETALRQQQAVTAADDAARAAGVALDALADANRKDADAFYHNRPVVRCLDPERVHAIKNADAAADAAARAAIVKP